MTYASIDIGTNTLLLLILEFDEDNNYSIVVDEHRIARLGEGVDQTKTINNDAINRATEILFDYKFILSSYNINKLDVVSTSAMRDATNSKQVKELFEAIIGTEIKIISGEEEAMMSYLGSIENEPDNILIDIGGGSTEIIYGTQDTIEYRKSLDIGAVRVTERFLASHPSSEDEIAEAKKYINEQLSTIDSKYFKGNIIAVAGTPTTMAHISSKERKYTRELIHNKVLDLKELDRINELFNKTTKTDLYKKYNVHPKRADIILGGGLILTEFMRYINYDKITVSCNGLRYGVIFNNFI